MKLALIILIAIWSLIASASPGQPYFVRPQTGAGSGSLDLVSQQMNLKYYWNAVDLTNGVPVTNWVDRIQGVVASQSDAANRGTNSPIGVRFNKGGSIHYDITNLLSLKTNVMQTNVTVFLVYNWEGPQAGVKPVLLGDKNSYVQSGGWGQCALEIDPASGDTLYTPGEQDGKGYTIIQNPGPSKGIVQDVIFQGGAATTNKVYTNGVMSAVAVGPLFTNITSIGITNAEGAGLQDFNGWIALIAIATNSPITSTMVSNLHYYRTNVFGGSP